jgi:hypothetical protein
MNKIHRQTICCVLVVVALLLSVTVVAAKELGALGISGPGINGELKLDNTNEMMKLDRSGFFDLSQKIKAPEGLNNGYTIVRYLHMEEGLIAWDKLVYYPDAAGKQGYLYYAGSVDKNHEGVAGAGWYQVRRGAEPVFSNLMAAHGVAVASGAPVVAQSAAKQPAGEASQAQNAATQPESQTRAAAPAASGAEPARGGVPETVLMLGIGVIVASVVAWAFLRRRQRIAQVSMSK